MLSTSPLIWTCGIHTAGNIPCTCYYTRPQKIIKLLARADAIFLPPRPSDRPNIWPQPHEGILNYLFMLHLRIPPKFVLAWLPHLRYTHLQTVPYAFFQFLI